MDNPEKLATQSTQYEEKQNKKLKAICVVHHYTQTNTNNVKTEIVTNITTRNSERKDT